MTKIEFENYVKNDLKYEILFDPVDNEIIMLFTKHNNDDPGIYVGHPLQAVARVRYKDEGKDCVQQFLFSLSRPLSSSYELYTIQQGSIVMVDKITMQPSMCYLGAQPENRYVYLYFANLLLDQYLNKIQVTEAESC